MLPYIIVLPIWLLVAIVLPLAQTLHALQAKSEDRKRWLFYWIAYAMSGLFLYYFEWLINIPFYLLSFYIDLYYETQILLALVLVFPKTMYISKVHEHVERNAAVAETVGKSKFKDGAQVAYGKFNELKEKFL
mmetsp:Transcript_120219/g.239283  ORF Transcript_120219/g.239283 Transcript_120219/m.239283 type:complete len:133 (+) Transcript_120219:66-464(+)